MSKLVNDLGVQPLLQTLKAMALATTPNEYTNWNLAYTARQGSRVSCLAQTGFAAFGKAVQLISGSPYAETATAA